MRGKVAAGSFIGASLLIALSAFLHPSSAAPIACDANALVTAIQNAVNAGGTQVVDLALGCTYTLTTANNNSGTVDANGLPQIGNNVNLQINGSATIQRSSAGGTPRFRFFQVLSGATLTLNQVVLINGYTPDGPDGPGNANAGGGNGGNGGAINNAGTLHLNGSRVNQNRTGQGGHANGGVASGNSGSGGGIYNSGTMTALNALIDTNQTSPGYVDQPYGQSARGPGGGIYSNNSLTVTDSTMQDNTAGVGGGVENFGGTATVTGTTFEFNHGETGGGFSDYFSGTASLTNCTFYLNESTGEGGGVWADGTINVTYCTFSGNKAAQGGAVYAEAPGFTISNSILANSPSGGNCAITSDETQAKRPAVSFGFTDGDYNIEDTDTCGFNAAHSQKNTDPKLDPNGLADNGGPTQTIALRGDSPAIDKIDNGINGCGTTVKTDQRGVVRPQNNACDIGAFEVTCAEPPDGMISWWPAEGDANDIQDHHDGFMTNGATFAPGKVGQAFSLDGDNDFVDLGDVDLPQTFTIDAWIYPTDLSTQPMIFSKDDGNNRSYYFELGGSGQFGAEVVTPNGDTQYGSSIGAVVANQWQHVAMTYDGTAGADAKIKFYVNGVQVPSTHLGSNDAGGVPNNTSVHAKIGIYGDDSSYVFKGRIDEVEVFGRALAEEEIASIAKASTSGKCRSCVGAPGSMVSWWKGEGDATDSQDGNDGTLRGGATFGLGKVGQGFSLNGSGQYVEVADKPNISLTSPFTIDAWIKTNDNTSEHAIVEKYDGGGTNGYFFRLSSSGELVLGVCNVSGCDAVSGNTPIPTGEFHHVTGLYNGTSLRVYLDGALDGTKSTALTPTNGTNPLTIGARGGTVGNFFNGIIDEVEIFNRALTQREIQAIYDAQSGGKCPCVTPPSNLVDWWPGDGNTNDIQGTNDAALQNGATFGGGEVAQGFSLDGTDDSVVASASGNTPSAITLDAWINPDSLGDGRPVGPVVFEKGTALSSRVGLQITTDGKLCGYVNSDTFNVCSAAGIIPTGQFTHVALTATSAPRTTRNIPAAGQLTLYVNGAQVAQVNGSDVLNVGTARFVIGDSETSGLYDNFGGIIDEVEMFDRALTADEIAALYRAGGAGKCKPQAVPTPTPTATPTATPTPTATATATVTPAARASEVEGGGSIAVAGGEARFNVHLTRGRNGKPKGSFSYNDPNAPLNIDQPKIRLLSLRGSDAHFTGVVKHGTHTSFSFTVDITDGGMPGTLDTFSISTSRGYHASGHLIRGDVRVN